MISGFPVLGMGYGKTNKKLESSRTGSGMGGHVENRLGYGSGSKKTGVSNNSAHPGVCC